MKKTYIIPAVQVIAMHATSMLAGSNTSLNLGAAEEHSTGGTLTGAKDNNGYDDVWTSGANDFDD